ncbi:maleylpyruvate isomerase family mycothiol-dependent enzyme [Streptomyces sp. GbtcB6]|uniref:maleylpyruvate isomerase family mycothiol-dependent enzyme n=1 Tax=Streptomyces sp. GbtcB6 TaxID=2824751 RepID=UPI001C2FEF75|nr:maleylpyruvate isomerase family mycothiol-dependent enzyme [Streptomyces sp. GbtcB6]
MTVEGMTGFRLLAQDVLALAGSLDDDDWRRPSGAEGWTVKDVFSHAGQLISLLVATVQGVAEYPDPPLGIERLNEVMVGPTRERKPAAIVDFLRAQAEIAFPVFEGLQHEPLASSSAEMLNLGTYELHAIPNMFTFDLAAHLHFDLLAPRGPLKLPRPPMGEERIGPAVYWLMAGIPRMQPDLYRSLQAPIGLDLTGPASTSVVVRRVGDAVVVEAAHAAPDPVAVVTSSTFDFLAWSTTRAPWREVTRVAGDVTVAASFLDRLNLV